jgi:L-ascorbate metabolism protein UlaG (beta-lactamase superfamily)
VILYLNVLLVIVEIKGNGYRFWKFYVVAVFANTAIYDGCSPLSGVKNPVDWKHFAVRYMLAFMWRLRAMLKIMFAKIPWVLMTLMIAYCSLSTAQSMPGGATGAEGNEKMRNFAEQKIHWLGHDAFKITENQTIYIDPFQLKSADKADVIFLTHDHYDHLSLEDIDKIRRDDTVIVAPADCSKKLSGNAKFVKAGDKLNVKGIDVEVVPAYNTNKKFHPKANGWVGYVMTIGGTRVYHAGDTDLIPEMKNIKADIAMLPVSGTYVMTAEEAAQAALAIQPKIAIPMHYGSVAGAPGDGPRFKATLEGKIEVLLKTRE